MSRVNRYRPSNASEGESFMSRWCDGCARDAFNPDTGEGGCRILADTFAFEISDPRYPKEWIADESGPRCTAFIEEGKEIPYRCPETTDMFGAGK